MKNIKAVQKELQARAFQLMKDAQAAGQIVLISMNTEKQQKVHQSKDFVIVAPYKGEGPTLIHPEPSTTGQRYNG